jgi:nucleoside phosphorylase
MPCCPMQNRLRHSRYELLELLRHCRDFERAASRGSPTTSRDARTSSWLSSVRSLHHEQLDDADRLALLEALEAAGRAIVTDSPDVVATGNSLRLVAGGLESMLKHYEFEPTKVGDRDFEEFLRAALHVDEDLCQNDLVPLDRVAELARLDLGTARRCLARLIDEGLGYLDRDDSSQPGFMIESRDVAFTLERLQRSRGTVAGQSRGQASGADVPRDETGIAGALSTLRSLRSELEGALAHSPQAEVSAVEVAKVLATVDVVAAEALSAQSRGLGRAWDEAIRPADSFGESTGDVRAASVLERVVARIAVLERIPAFVDQHRGSEVSKAEQPEPVILAEPPPGGLMPPGDAARSLLAVFDFMQPGQGKPLGRSQLRRAMIDFKRGPVPDANLDAAIAELVDGGFLREAPHPGPTIKIPEFPDLPGVPKLKAQDVYTVADPQPGELCYATTPRGAKSAQLSRTLLGRAQPAWQFGAARLVDQVVCAFRPPFPSAFETIDAQCCCASTTEVRAAIEEAVSSGLLRGAVGDAYQLTFDGEGRLQQLTDELRPMTQVHPAEMRIPSADDFDIAIICALPRPELDKVKRAGGALWEPLPSAPDDPSSYFATSWKTEAGSTLRVVAASPTQMGMPASSVLATKMILRFRPKLVAMVGIAAGTRTDKQGFGDVLAADRTFDYNAGKVSAREEKLHFEPDPNPISIPARLRDRLMVWSAQRIELDLISSAWPANSPRTRLSIHVGALGSGAAVIDARQPVTEVLQHWRKLVGIEMEAYGVHIACRDAVEPAPAFLCLKGVCDFALEKGDEWQDYAAYCAAEVCFRFLVKEWEGLHLGNSSRR